MTNAANNSISGVAVVLDSPSMMDASSSMSCDPPRSLSSHGEATVGPPAAEAEAAAAKADRSGSKKEPWGRERRRRWREKEQEELMLHDTLRHMRRLERTTYRRPHADALPEPFHGEWRRRIVEWMYCFIRYCRLRHEAAAAAAYYLDAAVAHKIIGSPERYQLGAVAAVNLALKVYDSPSVRLVKLSSLVHLGNGAFGEQDVVDMERDMIWLMRWRLNPPTVNCFVQQYLLLLFPVDAAGDHEDDDDDDNETVVNDGDAADGAPTSSALSRQLEEVALQCIELAMGRDYFLPVDSSVIGYAVILMAIEILDQASRQQQTQTQQPVWSVMVDVQAFVDRMARVAMLDPTSVALVRASVLLDRTMKSLPIPSIVQMEEETASSPSSPVSPLSPESAKCGDDDDCHESLTTADDGDSGEDASFIETARIDGYSPNNVALR